MGLRYTTRLFKPSESRDITAAVLHAASQIGAYARPSEEKENANLLRIGERSGVYTADCPFNSGDYYLFSELATKLGGVWLEARIQEGSHWDYTLRYPGCVLDSFSTLPQYLENDELLVLASQGRPELLAKAWEVSVESIERYIRQWGYREVDEHTYESILRGKAYPTDRAEYGQYDQLFDLLEKLHYSTNWKWCFELRFSELNYSPKRHFLNDLSVAKNP